MDWNAFPDYDIIWCDPPWNQKMVNYFESILLKDGQQKPGNSIECIIDKLGELSSVEKPLFIEYSTKGFEFIIKTITNRGHVFSNNVFSTQENGNPYVILVFNSADYSPAGDKRGFKIIDDVCDNLKFNIVFDPFAGIGRTAKAFTRNGKTYIGSEINTQRFNKLKKVIWDERL